MPWKPTEESNENIDIAIDTPPKCLAIPLNSTNCNEGDDLLKLDEPLKEICKCHHQKYFNTKPIINYINRSNCLEQKCGLIMEKIVTILKLALNIKPIVKSQETRKQNMLEKTNSCEKPPPEKSTNFHKIQRNFHDTKNHNNEEN